MDSRRRLGDLLLPRLLRRASRAVATFTGTQASSMAACCRQYVPCRVLRYSKHQAGNRAAVRVGEVPWTGFCRVQARSADGRFQNHGTDGGPRESAVGDSHGQRRQPDVDCVLQSCRPRSRPVRLRPRAAVWINEFTDLQSGMVRVGRGELSLGSWMRSYRRPRYYAWFSWKDPMPAFVMGARLAVKALKRGFMSIVPAIPQAESSGAQTASWLSTPTLGPQR